MTGRTGRGAALWALTALAVVTAAAVWWFSRGSGLSTVAASTSLFGGLDVADVRAAVADAGVLAPVVYVAFVTVEVVVAPLPGFLLYGPGGAIFGGFWGGTLALIGNLLGAALAFGATRWLGRARVADWLRDSDLERLERRLAENGFLVVFLLRLNPLTSSDIVSYAAGLSSISAGRMLAGTALGLAPLCWLQAYAAEGLLARYPWLLYPAIGAAIAYVGLAALLAVGVLRRGVRRG